MKKQEDSSRSRAWKAIFDKYSIEKYDFDSSPYLIDTDKIKEATKHFQSTGEREPRILCKHDTRESRPELFKNMGLFLLPIKNGKYALIKGEGYVDIPPIVSPIITYQSKLEFQLETSMIGDSEMQHLDFAYASSLFRHFMKDDSLVLTIRGRKYTPEFELFVNHHKLSIRSVQTEVDAGYEGKNQVVLIEAKNSDSDNVIIRQLYFPFRQWQLHTSKKVVTIFFSKRNDIYYLWQFEFKNFQDYNSIELVKSERFKIKSWK